MMTKAELGKAKLKSILSNLSDDCKIIIDDICIARLGMYRIVICKNDCFTIVLRNINQAYNVLCDYFIDGKIVILSNGKVQNCNRREIDKEDSADDDKNWINKKVFRRGRLVGL